MSVRILQGDCRNVLPTLAAGSVQCVVTSPPYFGLRDYGVAGQIGLEPTPAAFVAEMVAVFGEVRRVLRDDGTCWLNLGDSYANDGKWGGYSGDKNTESATGTEGFRLRRLTGMKPKDLIMIPARVALALQADGWFLRSDIIWAKPNPMPESVTDRPTSSHEHVFLLTKRARYFYEADAVREDRTQDEDATTFRGGCYVGGQTDNGVLGRRTVVGNTRKLRPSVQKGGFGGKTADQAQPAFRADYGSRNLRNVWTIATAPYPEAHFATFPPELAERCIKAGSKPGDMILDPFAGAFTTALAADRLQRHAIGIELNPAYCAMAQARIERDAGMFAEVAAE
jgi:DNA modification methylase